jgi:hypothetical protein
MKKVRAEFQNGNAWIEVRQESLSVRSRSMSAMAMFQQQSDFTADWESLKPRGDEILCALTKAPSERTIAGTL